MPQRPNDFRCGLTADFLDASGKLVYRDIGLGTLDAADLRHAFLPRHEKRISGDLLSDLDAVISLTPAYDAASFAAVSERLLAVVRFGVGYEMVDVDACTEAGVALCITRGAVNESVAEATLTWMLALSHKLVQKDRLVRESRWADRGQYMGGELHGRTLGLIGAGGIGRALVRILEGFGMAQPLVFDPYLDHALADKLGLRPVDLVTLMSEADFVSVNCPLNDETRDLVDASALARMKPDAFLINTARGGIVNESALYDALKEQRIAGAATDVFAEEPAGGTHPFCQLDNILLAPHCFAWTDELFARIGRMATEAVVDFARGEVPQPLLVNPEVLDHPGFRQKLARFQNQPAYPSS
jgi:phosphoglycerate dehydrogenase-like enzyme